MRDWVRALVTLAGLSLAPGPVHAQPAIVAFEVEYPRAFGHVIGDVLTQRVVAEVARPYRLREDALPRSGRRSAWLELRGVTVRCDARLRSHRYELAFSYQLFNSPAAVKILSLPTVELEFVTDDGRTFSREVPAWPLTMAPIAPDPPYLRTGLGELRPDQPPQPLPTAPYVARLALYAAAAATILAYLAYAYLGLPFLARSRGPFARAHRALKALARRRGDPRAFRSGLRRLHRAFDETAGRTVFAEHLEGFFAQHPRYAELRGATERFFELSRREFFGGGVGEDARSLDGLLALCRACRDHERGVA